MPTQQRSRERVERMLAAASALIAEDGSDAMRMSEVAERAGVPIGSLYQFFPDKGAIIRTLAERYNALGRACIEEELSPMSRDLDGLRDAFGRLVDIYYAMFLAEPVMRDIWSGTQADKALRDIDLDDSRQTGSAARRRARAARPDADRAAHRHEGVPDHESRRGDDAAGDLGRPRGRRRARRRLQARWRCRELSAPC